MIQVYGVSVQKDGGEWINYHEDMENVLGVVYIPQQLSFVLVTPTKAYHLPPQNTVKLKKNRREN